jgi:hypothetical protein
MLSAPVASSPVKSLTLLDDVIEASTYLFHGCVCIEGMSKHYIDVVHIQPLQRLVNALDNMFSIGAGYKVDILAYLPDLSCDDDILSVDLAVADASAKCFLTFAWD